MATSRIKTSSVLQGFPKSRSLLAGNAAYSPDNFESLSTVIVGSGGSSSITFSSIPQGYAHLQIRGISRFTTTAASIYLRANSISSGDYSNHNLQGNGSSAAAYAGANQTQIYVAYVSASSNIFTGIVIDLLDYTDTNKFKTIRNLTGTDFNGSGYLEFTSGNVRTTNAITNIELYPEGGRTFAQYTKFALYGIRD